jgi:N-acetylmuramoyl-L-alanine amidase
MNGLRHTGLALCAMVPILILAGGPHPARAQQQAPVAAAPPAPSCQRSAFHIVIDVGHTVNVPGADSARGIPEYAFNLQLSQDIDKALVDAGFDKTVLMITATAPWRGLVERAARANTMHADLFIAIHHDSVPDNLMQNWNYDGQPQQYNDDYPGYAIFISNDNADRAGSLLFGHLLGMELQARGLHYTPHYTLALMGRHRRVLLDADAGVYRFDELIVLRETKMAAVLLEAGSIVNRQEEVGLGTPERRALTAAAIVAAADKFCAAKVQPAVHPATAKAAAAPDRISPAAPHAH